MDVVYTILYNSQQLRRYIFIGLHPELLAYNLSDVRDNGLNLVVHAYKAVPQC